MRGQSRPGIDVRCGASALRCFGAAGMRCALTPCGAAELRCPAVRCVRCGALRRAAARWGALGRAAKWGRDMSFAPAKALRFKSPLALFAPVITQASCSGKPSAGEADCSPEASNEGLLQASSLANFNNSKVQHRCSNRRRSNRS